HMISIRDWSSDVCSSDLQPVADGIINRDDGTSLRIHALLAPPSESGTCLSIRVLRQRNTTLDDLVDNHTVTRDIAELLRAMVSRLEERRVGIECISSYS